MKKKIILFEPEMLSAKGHFLDNLIESTCLFKKKFQVLWFLNKNFNPEKNHIPKNITIKKIIESNIFKRKNNKFFYLVEEIGFFFTNIFDIIFFLFFFIFKRKMFCFLGALRSNYFVLPRYFKKFYLTYAKERLNENDHIFFQSSRRKDLALVSFITQIEKKFPKIHMRFFLPPTKRFKGSYFYLNKIKKLIKNKKIYLYSLGEYTKKTIEKNIMLKNSVELSNLPYSFYNRPFKNKILNVGFLGEARINKGFHLIPNLIKLINQSGHRVNFLIQFSKASKEVIKYKEELILLSKKYKNIKIIEKYCDYLEFRKLLEKIDIMPIMHDANQINTITSGILYSSITYEIPSIIPKKCNFMSDTLVNKSFEKYNNFSECVNKIKLISKNYSYYLKEAKKNSLVLKEKLNNDPLKKNFI
jgi:hypothetical protein